MLKPWRKFFLVWRIWLLMIVVGAIWWLPFRPAFEFVGLPFYNSNLAAWLSEWLWVWANFDGVIFLQNSAASLITEVRFLPLYPLLIKVVSGQWQPGIITWQQILAGLVIAHIAAVAMVKYFLQLLRLDFSEKVTQKAVWWLLVFPVSFFLVCVYTESLFLLLALGSFWAARQKKWWLSFGLVGVASITRLPGILLLIPMAWEWWSEWQKNRRPLFQPPHFLYGILAVTPLLLLMFIHYQTSGDPLAFVHAHGELANSRSTSALVFPAITLVRYFKILTSLPVTVFEWWVALLELGSVAFLGLVVYWSWRLKLRTSYQLYTLSMAALPVLSGTFSGLPRYLLIIFPIYLVLALKVKKWQWRIAVAMLLLQAVLLLCFSRGYYIA